MVCDVVLVWELAQMANAVQLLAIVVLPRLIVALQTVSSTSVIATLMKPQRALPSKIYLDHMSVPYHMARTYTADLLDLLDRYDAKATFFISGINNSKGPIDHPDLPWASLIQRMQRTKHQIASHTWSHQDLSKVTPEQRRQQILKNEAAFRNVLGKIPTYMRPPYSSCLPETGCLDDMGTMGYHIILYDIDTKDYSHDSPSAIQVSKNTFDAALSPWKASEKSWLVIAHDVHEQTVHNLTEHMLRRMAEYGYKAVTVGECLEDPQEFWYREAGEPLSNNAVRKSSSPEAHDAPSTVSKPVSPDVVPTTVVPLIYTVDLVANQKLEIASP
ncbi:hypothetical protein V6000_007107 [Aspergillus fumigatus]